MVAMDDFHDVFDDHEDDDACGCGRAMGCPKCEPDLALDIPGPAKSERRNDPT